MGVKSADETTADQRRQCMANCHVWSLVIVLVGTAYVVFLAGCFASATDYKLTIPGWEQFASTFQRNAVHRCKDQGKPLGTEPLPNGIVSQTSNLEMLPMLEPVAHNKRSKISPKNLLAMAIGIKQKEIVDQIVTKFLSSNFTVMLFHYDGKMQEWKHFQWCDQAVHVSAINQTKWWFARRFLHPDIVAEYNYIFLWDEDLGTQHFSPSRYLQIIQEEGLEISQPALDTKNRRSIHYDFTARQKEKKVHRRVIHPTGVNKCHENITGPPCAGFIEVMAPVFSRAAWRCVWHMIQTDMIFGWGLDFKFGYCAQGDRMQKIGIVDAEYVEHMAVPSLGGSNAQNTSSASSPRSPARQSVINRSFSEWRAFERRWKDAAEKDECWKDPYSAKIK